MLRGSSLSRAEGQLFTGHVSACSRFALDGWGFAAVFTIAQESGTDSERAQAMRKGQAELMTLTNIDGQRTPWGHVASAFDIVCKCGSRMFRINVRCLEKHPCATGTGFVAVRDLPESDDEEGDDEIQAVEADGSRVSCMSPFGGSHRFGSSLVP